MSAGVNRCHLPTSKNVIHIMIINNIFQKQNIYLLKIQVRIILGRQLPELRVHSQRWLRWNLLHSGILTFAACIPFCGDQD